MRSPLRKPRIPVPKGFDDPVKEKCAHAERRWTLVWANLASGAATAGAATATGVALPPLAPVLAAGAAVCALLKINAQWAKEDPPRDDFHQPARMPERRIDTMQLLPRADVARLRTLREWGAGGPLSDFLLLVSQVEEAGLRLGATVEGLEKSLGAELASAKGDDEAEGLSSVRLEEARVQALLTSYALRAVAAAAEISAANIADWMPPPPDALPMAMNLWEAIDVETAGRLLSAGVDPTLLEAPLPPASGAVNQLPKYVGEAGGAAKDLAIALDYWATGDEGPGPEESGTGLSPRPGGSEGWPGFESWQGFDGDAKLH